MVTIVPAAEIWASQKDKKEYEEVCSKTMEQIKAASAEGERSCYFPCSDAKSCYYAVKKAFRAKGYSFEPYGCIDGVWQDAERICW